MFRSLSWTIIRSQLNLRKLYKVIYKINKINYIIYIILFIFRWRHVSALILGHHQVTTEFEENVQVIYKINYIYLKFNEISFFETTMWSRWILDINKLFYKLHCTVYPKFNCDLMMAQDKGRNMSSPKNK